MTRTTTTVLDNAVWHALTGPQSSFAEAHPQARRYRIDVAPFAGLDDVADPQAWADLELLSGRGGSVVVTGPHIPVPPGWKVVADIHAAQLVDTGVDAQPTNPPPDLVRLGQADVPEMLDLVERTQPGPFLPKTVELGGYIGIRRGGRLIAMAGHRMQPPGWIEVSAVCTDPDHRGQGLARRVLGALTADIHGAGRRAFLHVTHANTNAIALYKSLGFAHRADVHFLVLQAPGSTTG
jgi:ribosomal protein S18 acetylase RimI-like enzyme